MKPLHQVFAAPALLGLLCLIGLLSALLADGPWDGLSWLTLGWVVAVAAWYGALASPKFASPKTKRGCTTSASTSNQTAPP